MEITCWNCSNNDPEYFVLDGDSIFCTECNTWNGYYDFSVDEETKQWNLKVRWKK